MTKKTNYKINPSEVKVLYDSILVKIQKEVKEEESKEEYVKTEAGILLPAEKEAPKSPFETVDIRKYVEGEVVAVGMGYVHDKTNSYVPLHVNVGDIILIDPHNSANGVKFDDEKDESIEYRLIREQNVLMVITKINEE